MGISIKGTRKTMNVAAEWAACEQVQVDGVEQLRKSELFNLHLPFPLTLAQKTGQNKLGYMPHMVVKNYTAKLTGLSLVFFVCLLLRQGLTKQLMLALNLKSSCLTLTVQEIMVGHCVWLYSAC